MDDHWNVLYQVTVFYADRKSKMAAIAGHRSKNSNFVENHPRNIPVKFGFNRPGGFGEET
jgi:hypothetical protein